MFILFGDIQKTCLLAKMTVMLLHILLRATAGHYGFLRRPGSSFFVSNKLMSSCVNCLVSAREIFPASVGLFGDHKSAYALLAIELTL